MREYIVEKKNGANDFNGISTLLHWNNFVSLKLCQPIQRLCRWIAGNGYIAAGCESYHEFERPGTQLQYNDEDTEKGNRYKIEKEVSSYDSDAEAVKNYLLAHKKCNGKLGSIGPCLGKNISIA